MAHRVEVLISRPEHVEALWRGAGDRGCYAISRQVLDEDRGRFTVTLFASNEDADLAAPARPLIAPIHSSDPGKMVDDKRIGEAVDRLSRADVWARMNGWMTRPFMLCRYQSGEERWCYNERHRLVVAWRDDWLDVKWVYVYGFPQGPGNVLTASGHGLQFAHALGEPLWRYHPGLTTTEWELTKHLGLASPPSRDDVCRRLARSGTHHSTIQTALAGPYRAVFDLGLRARVISSEEFGWAERQYGMRSDWGTPRG